MTRCIVMLAAALCVCSALRAPAHAQAAAEPAAAEPAAAELAAAEPAAAEPAAAEPAAVPSAAVPSAAVPSAAVHPAAVHPAAVHPAAAPDTGLVPAAHGDTLPERISIAFSKVVTPYVVIAGGFRFERLMRRDTDTAQSRNLTLAVSQMGLRGSVGERITFRSELEANLGGPLGYGASVWEGQAQLTVRDQWVRYERGGVGVAVGRVTDHATIDFHSAHVADLLLLDFYTRWPILLSGGDRGTGVVATYDIRPDLRAGITLRATNPTGFTGSYQVGGSLFPYTRPFLLAAAQVGRSADKSPDFNLHMYLGTASLMYARGPIEAKAAVQGYVLDTQMFTDQDQRIYGYNVRGNIKFNLAGGKLAAWLNGSRNENELLDPLDARIKLVETYTVHTFGAGLDVNYDGHNGVGLQYAVTREHERAEPVLEHYLNLGTTYWIEPGVLSVGGRLGYYVMDNRQTENTGHASLFVTARLIL